MKSILKTALFFILVVVAAILLDSCSPQPYLTEENLEQVTIYPDRPEKIMYSQLWNPEIMNQFLDNGTEYVWNESRGVIYVEGRKPMKSVKLIDENQYLDVTDKNAVAFELKPNKRHYTLRIEL